MSESVNEAEIIFGRAAILRFFAISDWRSIEHMAERSVDPLLLQWDAFDRPWLERHDAVKWQKSNNRGHRYMRIEREIRRDPSLAARLGGMLPEKVRRRGKAA